MSCPNKNLPQYKELIATYGEGRALAAWTLNNEQIPTVEQAAGLLGMRSPTVVNMSLKVVEAIGTEKVQKLYDKFYKSNPEKFYSELIPLAGKQQVELLRDYNSKNSPTSLQDMLTGIMAEMSYTVEVNIGKNKLEKGGWGSIGELSGEEINSSFYSNLTVPGGTNYTENEIATPGITPSIKGHAQFSKDQGIGWFRSDDSTSNPKTRRILEAQSDLFQKGRDKNNLVAINIQKSTIDDLLSRKKITQKEYNEYLETISRNENRNQFLQLLNKDGNWVPFFIKIIIQDSAKKGYEKVLFPTGDTASKIEGHQTLEDFKKQKEDRIKELEQSKNNTKISYIEDSKEWVLFLDNGGVRRGYDSKAQIFEAVDNEIAQLKEELKRVETEGFAALKPIYNFYENRVYRELEKMYSKEGVSRIKEKYGNEWYEVEIVPDIDLQSILLQVSNNKALPDAKITQQIQKFIDKLGGKIQYVPQIVINGQVYNANAVADVLSRTIQIADGKENINTLPEEAAHIYFAMLPDNHPLKKELLKDIKGTAIYADTLKRYGSNVLYQNADGSVNTTKIAIEAVGKKISEAIVTGKDKIALSWWERLWNFIRNVFKGKSDAFQEAAKDILTGNVKKLNIKAIEQAAEQGRYYFELSDEQERYYKTLSSLASAAQKAIIDDLVYHPSVSLDEPTHTYTGLDIDDKTVYTSVTTGIGIQGPPNPQDYNANREWGKDFDRILTGVVERRLLKNIPPTPYITDAVREKLYNMMEQYIGEHMALGWIPLTQVPVGDRLSAMAGTIDLLWVLPDGTLQVVDLKSSWNSTTSDYYYNTLYNLKPDSKVLSSSRFAITKKQQHSIQVNSYVKLLQVHGYQKFKNPQTIHYRITAKDGIAVDVQEEKPITHDTSEMTDAVNQLVPTQVSTINKLDKLGAENPVLTEDYKKAEEAYTLPVSEIKEVFTEDEEKDLQRKLKQVWAALQKYRDLVHERTKSEKGARQTPVERINRLINDMQIEIGAGNWQGSYILFLEYANKQTADLIGRIQNPNNFNTIEAYKNHVTKAQVFIDALNTELQIHSFIQKDKEMLQLALQLNDLVISAQNTILTANRYIVANNVIKPNTSNPLLTEQVIMETLIHDMDISDSDKWVSDLANSGNVVLENLDKKIKVTVFENQKKLEEDVKKFTEAANKLVAAVGTNDTKTLYDILFQKDAAGKKTGRILNKIGDKYWKKRDAVIAPTLDSKGDGTPLEYILEPKTTEDLEFNKKLALAKKAVAEFQSPENVAKVDGIWQYEDGEYHYLSDEYKAERDKYFDFVYGKFIPKPNMQNEVNEFRNKYMQFQPELIKADYENGQPTGTVSVDTNGKWYPKREYVLIRDYSSKGEDMTDATWRKLKTGTTALEKAQWDFLNVYRDTIGQQVEQLTPRQQIWYEKQYIPAVASSFWQSMTQEGAKKGELILSEIKDWFTANAFSSQTEIQRMAGSLNQTLPLVYTANMQSQDRLDIIVRQINEHNLLKNSAKSPRDIVAWTEKAKELEILRQKELNRLTPEEIHPDLAKGAIAFMQMTSKFVTANSISSDVASTVEVIRNAEYEQVKRDLTGKVIGKEVVKGINSNTYARISTYVQQILEHDETANKELADVIATKAMKLTSTVGMAFNWFGHIHNVLAARLMSSIDSWGDELYQKASLRKMKVESVKAMAKKAAMAGRYLKKKDYTVTPPASKFEAMSTHFNMVEHQVTSDPGKVSLFGALGYGSMQEGEWLVQSEVGNAILDSIILKDKDGNEKSLYDVYKYDENKHTLTLPNGWFYLDGRPFTAKEEATIHNRIRETNKRIFGNYRDIDKTVLERYSSGKLIMQYHKWVYPAYKARFRRAKWDENLGAEGMWNEGRYQSAAKMVRALLSSTMTIQQLWESTLKDTSKMSREDKMKFLKDNYGTTLSLEEYKNFEDKLELINKKIASHESLKRQYTDTPKKQQEWATIKEKLKQEKATLEYNIDVSMAKLLEHRRNNLKKAAADLLYIAILFATYLLLKMIADRVPDDDPFFKKLVHWMMWEADRNQKELELMTPGVGILEAYNLIKNPIPVLSTVRDFGQVLNAAIEYPFVSDEKAHFQRGVNEGELKLWKETTDIIPIWKQLNRWDSFRDINNYFVK